jgi:flagellin-like hook-associated protein FlgL
LASTDLARTPSTNSNLAIGTVLDVAAVGTGTATAITFGTGAGQIKDLNGLNAALASNNLQATVDAAGTLTIQTNNDNASLQIGALTGSTNLFAGKSASAPVQDAAAQATRANLVGQFNNILSQITTTSKDASFNGVNLLNGDSLKLVFNETGKSTLNITGTTFDAPGLGLANLTIGTDFIDNNATNKALASLSSASDSLRSQASAFGSNLSIVQIRQDFSKNLINVLQTGSSNLTLADTNEEAANSQALSTRQSIAVSALALANQSQQSVLQLLR